MGVPSAPSGGSPLWVRGPSTQQAAPVPSAPATPTARSAPAAPTAPTKRSAPTAPTKRSAPTAPSTREASSGRTAQAAPSWPIALAEQAPTRHRGHQVAWVSAHGGAGASTLARVLGGADVGRRWPDPAQGEPGRILLVARTHAAGTRAVSQVLNALRMAEHPAGVRLIAVVLVADAPGRLPRALGRRVRVLRSAAKVHRVPWIPAWRAGEDVDRPPREVRTLASLVSAPSRRVGRPL
ncbi:DUF6668 family protein [Streptomyces sp. OE57]|uniref:DUF6668 family protein n=1 Tax=Streptomyces lacaronensis TaxID=3379885 RepID=UPI0039B7473D